MVDDRGSKAPADAEKFVAPTTGAELPTPPKSFPTTGELNTDVIESEMKVKLHAHKLLHNSEMREAHLEDESGVSWTYALTFFTEKPENSEIEQIDQEIQNGGLIGQVFRAHDYEIRKNVIGVRDVVLPPYLRKAFSAEEDRAKTRLSEFYAKKEGESPIIYGTVVEIYNPKFRKADVYDQDRDQVNPTTEALEEVGVSRDEIWNRLGSGNQWSDIAEKVKAARVKSVDRNAELKKEIDGYLSSHS